MRGMPSPILGLGEILWDLIPAGKQPGGAPFNFTIHCHQLGWPAIPVSRVGNDDLGKGLRSLILGRGLPDAFLQVDPDYPTGTVGVTLDSTGQPTYVIHTDVAWDHLAFNEDVASLIGQSQAICFGTLAQRHPVSRETVQRMVRHANAAGILVVFDLNLRPPYNDLAVIEESLHLATWLKLNDDELHELTSRLHLAGTTPSARLACLRDRYHLDLVALTRGAEGCLIQTGREEVDLPGVKVDVVDTIGAGDAFTAALLVAHLQGKTLRQSASWANRIAALVASRPGGTPVLHEEEIRECLR